MNIAQKEAWMARYQEKLPRLRMLQGELSAEIERYRIFRNPVGKGEGRDRRIGELSAEILDRISKLQKEIRKIELMREEITYTISKVDNHRHKKLLQYHYIDGLSWRQVACRMICSDRYIYRLHKKALEQVELYGTKRPYRLENRRGRMQCFDQEEKQLPGVILVDESTLRKVSGESDD